MLSRTYDFVMPSNGTTDVDIPVENFNPSVAAAPVAVGADGFYSEWRNRPIRVPIKAGSAVVPATGFVPRLRLGFSAALLSINSATTAVALPNVQFSRSLVGNVFSTAAGVTTQGDATFQDPGGAPTIRVKNATGVAARKFRLSLCVMDRDEDDQSKAG